VVGAGLAVVLVLGVVGLRVQQVRLSYRLDALRQGRAELEETNRRLRVEMATLKSLSASRARPAASSAWSPRAGTRCASPASSSMRRVGAAALDQRAELSDGASGSGGVH